MSDLRTCPSCGTEDNPVLEMEMNGTLTPTCPRCSRPYEAPAPRPVATLQPVERPQTAPQSLDPIELIHKRLQFLDSEIAKLEKYSKERKRLQRMLKAAK